MSEQVAEQCWFRRFGYDQCKNVGRWYWPEAKSELVRTMVWCDEHHHPNDTLIEVAEAPDVSAEVFK